MSRYEQIRERCRRFWSGESVDRPLVGALFNRMAPLSWFTEARDRTLVRPGDLTADLFREDTRRRHLASLEIGGDTGFVACPCIGIPWLEAVFGCGVRASGGSAWSEPLEGDRHEIDLDSIPWDNGWFDRMQEQTRIAVDMRDEMREETGEPLPAGPCHLRGLGDLAAALVGRTDFCLALYDEPAAMHRLIDVGAEVWRRIVSTQFAAIPKEPGGGYWNANQPIWCPGKSMFIPADVASLVSPSMFADFFYRPLRRMLEGLDYSIMHTHSTYLDAYPLDLLLGIDELAAVQVGIDTHGPDIETVLPKMLEIVEEKRLIVAGTLSSDQIRRASRKLPAERVCFLTYQKSIEACRRVLSECGAL